MGGFTAVFAELLMISLVHGPLKSYSNILLISQNNLRILLNKSNFSKRITAIVLC